MTGQAPYVCPLCLIAPILFEGNRDWNNGAPVVECLCLAPFSPVEGYQAAVSFDPWEAFFPTAEEWEKFVRWKLSQPVEEDEEE